MPVPNADFVAVAAGGFHSLGLKSDGSVVAWGWNYDWHGRYIGQCDVPAPNSGFIAVAAGLVHSVGLKADGSIVVWGAGTNPPQPNADFIAVSAGGFHSMGLKADGSFVTWGQRADSRSNPGYVAIAAGFAHMLALGPFPRFDTNCDHYVDFGDINPFVLALGGRAAYQAAYPDCNWVSADANFDGTVDFADINPFVAKLIGP